jgi:MFS family permease
LGIGGPDVDTNREANPMQASSLTRSLLRRNRSFRLLWTARTVSFIGSGVGGVGIVLHLADTRQAVLAVTLLMLCGDFAPALLSPLTGVLADRVQLRRLMLLCAAGQALVTAAIALWLPPLALLLAFYTARSVLEQVFTPASRTVVPDLVADGDLESANAHMGFGEHGLPVVGPLLAALLLPVIGVRGVILVDAVSYAAMVGLLWGLPAVSAKHLDLAEEGSFLRHAADGLRFLWRSVGVRFVVFSFVAVVAFNAVDDIALVFLAKDVLGSGDTGISLVYAGAAAGLLLGFAVVSRWGSLLAMPALLVIGYAISSMGNFMTGLAWALPAAFALQTIRGLGIAAMDVASATLIQREVSRPMQGRTFANLYGAIGLAAGTSYILGGSLVGFAGPRVAFLVAGGGGLAVAAFTALRFWQRRQPDVVPVAEAGPGL